MKSSTERLSIALLCLAFAASPARAAPDEKQRAEAEAARPALI
nr:peptidase M20 [Bradyrhizobium sp.]